MAYRIAYGPSGTVLKEKRRKRRKWISAVAVFALVIGILRLFWIGDWMRDFLIPGDPDVTVAAWNTMVDKLRDGSGIRLAVAAFCEQVLEGAEIVR